MASQINFVTNNVNGLSTSKTKRIKIFLHLKNIIKNKGFIFLQETHTTKNSVKNFKEDFGKNNDLFFSHGTSNSCGVAIGICGNFEYSVKDQISDKNGRFLIIYLVIGKSDYILINLYNENNQKDQLKLLQDLDAKLDSINISNDTNIVFAGDLNFYFDRHLEAVGGNPTSKPQSVAKFINIKEKLNLCDIWRIRNPKTKRYTFRQRHYSGYLQRRLDYIFISDSLQQSVIKTDIKIAIATDHSPVDLRINIDDAPFQKGPGFWKYNTSLNKDPVYKAQARDLIRDFLNEHASMDEQAKLELLKYEIKKFTITFSKNKAKQKRLNRETLEKTLETMIATNVDPESENFKKTHDDLEKIYDEIAEGIRIRSKCNWYELGEKSTKYFLNLENKMRNPQQYQNSFQEIIFFQIKRYFWRN